MQKFKDQDRVKINFVVLKLFVIIFKVVDIVVREFSEKLSL